MVVCTIRPILAELTYNMFIQIINSFEWEDVNQPQFKNTQGPPWWRSG